jgi:hypothetical protein
MQMNHTANWHVGSAAPNGSNPVQAWASDSMTGEPVYIMQLGKDRQRSKCGCECQSCDLPLIAVNVANPDWKIRPHFRHPNGADKSECKFLAARMAALQLLREQGFIELPARKIIGKVIGLSGTGHEICIEHRPERLKIRDFDFRDKTFALLTLDDGRQLRFQLTGSSVRSVDGQILPTIFFDVKDPALAGMSPEELRKRTTLLPDGLCWHSHWKDSELQAKANEAALAKAIDLMDIEGEYLAELEDVPQTFRRETLLHLEVKRILSEAKQIHTPKINREIVRTTDDDQDIQLEVDIPAQWIPLLEVVLEKRFGGLIPDVTARTSNEHGGVLLIEVTVTNTIHGERQKRIRDHNVPALEIDLSHAWGTITRAALRDLVIDGLELKRWLCHPAADLFQQKLETEADAKLKEENDAIQKRKAANQMAFELVRKTPVEVIAKDYLNAIYLYERSRNGKTASQDDLSRLLGNIHIHAKRLEHHGFGVAMDDELFGSRAKIIPRILAIKNGGGVGYIPDTTMGVMESIKKSPAHTRVYHSLYLIAEKVYRNNEGSTKPSWYLDWVKEIKKSIISSAQMYARPSRYDRLLSLLFPEMTASLERPGGKENYWAKRKIN